MAENEESVNGRIWLIIASVSGLLVVSLGAFGAHALKGVLDPYGESIWSKAVLYQMLHTGALLAVGIIRLRHSRRGIDLAGMFFTAGIILFSGSLYILALSGVKLLGMITPLGGVSFLVGWALLARAFWIRP